MRKVHTLAFVMAGGKGKGLHPPAAERPKPAVPVGAR
jgi:ADP-glucose pyrophosphorylase